MLNGLFRLRFLAGVFSLESFHTACGVHDFLFSCHERMALGTDFGLDVLSGRPCLDHIPADTGDVCFLIFRMNALFHNSMLSFLKSAANPRRDPSFLRRMQGL
jgi:hypothetical protein